MNLSAREATAVFRTGAFLALVWFSGPGFFHGKGPGPILCEAAENENRGGRARLDGWINWDYRWDNNLSGARNTVALMRRTLETWYPGGEIGGRLVENGTPSGLRAFLEGLPGAAGERFDLVYLASHQSKDGEWRFPSGEVVSWSELLEGVKPEASARRIVVLDACYAERVPAGWHELSGIAVFASSAGEPTFQHYLNRRQPVYFRKYFPAEVAWLERHLGERWMRKDSQLTFFGFIWVRAFLRYGDQGPRDLEGWERFFRICEEEATSFREERHRGLSSTVRMDRRRGAGR